MVSTGSQGDSGGALAQLQMIARRAPPDAASAIRDVAQKECEVDARAHDGLVTRGNNLLAASGVALGLLIGLAKDLPHRSAAQSVLLVLAFLSAVGAGILVLVGSRFASANTAMKNSTILGKHVSEIRDAKDWERAYHLSLALSYCEVRMEVAARHRSRGAWLFIAQWFYFSFVCFVSILGLSILC